MAKTNPQPSSSNVQVKTTSQGITEHKGTKKTPQESEGCFHMLSELASDFTYSIQVEADNTLVPEWVTEAYSHVTSYAPDEAMVWGNGEKMLHPEDLSITHQHLQTVLSGQPYVSEYRIITKGGETRWLRDHAKPVWDEDQGRVVRIYGATRNITEQVMMEKALQELQERYRVIVEDMPALVCRFQPDGVLTFVNKQYCLYFNKQRKELIGQNFFQFIPEEDRKRVREHYSSLVPENPVITYEHKVFAPDGTLRWQRWTDRALFDQEGYPVEYQSIGEDITERKRAAEALIKSEERYRMVVEDMPALVCRFLQDGVLTYVNQHYCHYFKKNLEELIGHNFFQFIPEEEQERVRQYYASLTPENPVATYEHKVFAPDGTHRWQRWTDRALFDKQGQPLEYQSIGEDITERKQAEEALKQANLRLESALADLKATQKKVIQQERLAAVGQLAAGIAHDFNNTLMPITLYSEMLLKEPDLTPQIRARIGIILDQAQHASTLTQQILDFSRRSLMRLQPLDMLSFLDEFKGLLQRTLPENIHITLRYGSEDYWIKSDPARMEQAFMNLALNARDAMPGGGELRFELSRLHVEPDEPPPFMDMSPGDWVQVTVTDIGGGISPEHLPNIFEPFFTTKEAGEGSGLGLAQVYGIVKQHRGYIDVKSQVGKGTSFVLYFPAPLEEPEMDSRSMLSAQTEERQPRILVVEDDVMTRQAVCDTLEMLNYRVLMADSGQQAIEIYTRESVDLVLSDLVMPKMGGLALYEALHEVDPQVKMIVLTGYPLEDGGRELLDQGILAWVQKPLTIEIITRTVEDALRGEHEKS